MVKLTKPGPKGQARKKDHSESVGKQDWLGWGGTSLYRQEFVGTVHLSDEMW